MGAFTGQGAPPGQPAPPALPPPEMATASGERQRLSLFEEWLKYGFDRGEGFAIFESEKECYVQFAFGGSAKPRAEIGTTTWKEVFGGPLPESVSERLVQRGFQPPEADDENYWQEVEGDDARALAELTEWAFRQIFGEDGNFTVKVGNFD